MRDAMARADVGDDVYGEDPSINALEAEVAALFGHAAAMFVPTGTMSNQVGLRLLCAPGDELLSDADAHIVSYEGGSLAMHGGIQTRTVVMPRGLLTTAVVEPQLRTAGFHAGPTRAVAVEQTHNRGGGAVYPLAQLAELRALADAHAVPMHCDGARIWNAHIASGVSLAEYGALFDTMSVCLSKGLGAPVGSVLLVKDAARIEAARELRHQLGGAMRQAGVIAAGGLYAVRHHIGRLADDHARATRLATGIAEALPGSVDLDTVETNMVMVELAGTSVDAHQMEAACEAEGVLLSGVAADRVRLVTHLDVDDDGIERAVKVIATALTA
jgi:threonine aldolase